MLESAIQKNILTFLKTVPNCWSIKTIQSNKLGCPDILACIEGAFYAFEVKQEKGQTTAIQDFQLNQIKIAGGRSFIVRSVEDVRKAIHS